MATQACLKKNGTRNDTILLDKPMIDQNIEKNAAAFLLATS